jgi:hypothetical protein
MPSVHTVGTSGPSPKTLDNKKASFHTVPTQFPDSETQQLSVQQRLTFPFCRPQQATTSDIALQESILRKCPRQSNPPTRAAQPCACLYEPSYETAPTTICICLSSDWFSSGRPPSSVRPTCPRGAHLRSAWELRLHMPQTSARLHHS